MSQCINYVAVAVHISFAAASFIQLFFIAKGPNVKNTVTKLICFSQHLIALTSSFYLCLYGSKNNDQETVW